MSQTLIQFLSAIGGVIFVDLVLSGDNALVIGAAALGIPRKQRWLAFVVGGGGAILLRILFTSFATFLLQVQYLQAIGGLFVLFIAIRLLFEQKTGNHEPAAEQPPHEQVQAQANRPASRRQRFLERHLSPDNLRLFSAIATILIADVTMSLDNVVAIGALARGQILILAIGLLLSIVLLMVGSAMIAELLKRIPWLIIVASFVLAWVAGDLIVHDSAFSLLNPAPLAIYILTFATTLIFSIYVWVRRARTVPATK